MAIANDREDRNVAAPATPVEPATNTAGEKVSKFEANRLGFTSTEGITRRDGMYYFDLSLAPNRQGFQPVGVAGLEDIQMTPYFGDVTGDYRLTQEQFAEAYRKAEGDMDKVSQLILEQQDKNVQAAFEAFKGKLQAENPGWTGENLNEIARLQYFGISGGGPIGGMGGAGGFGGTGGGGYDINGQPSPGGQYNAQGQFVGASLGAGRDTNINVLKSILKGMGFNSSLVDTSANFLISLLKDGLDYDNAVEIFLNSKEYTTKDGKKVESPFYSTYGYLNEGLARPRSAAELYNAVEGYKEVVTRYNLNPKFSSPEYMKGYIMNGTSVADLSRNANLARLKAVNADAAYVDSLRRLGYIADAADLTDFYLDPKIGEETLNQRRATAALGAEAIKRAQQGVEFATTRFNQIASGLLSLGLSPEAVEVKAAEGMQNIAETLLPTAKLSAIYDKPNITQSGLQSQIQQELEAEQFQGLLSERRKRLREQEAAAFSAKSGVGTLSSGFAGAF